ncbi:MAG: helix-turn-helix transcriptional regulator [Bacteriovoracaceae bacterium]|nr:helix-turn-helix transcriptional regulator [Bacteriovoracaceae bacterium]
MKATQTHNLEEDFIYLDWSVVMPVFLSKNATVVNVSEYVLKNLSEEISLVDLAKSVDVSTFYLCRVFNKELGISPIKWMWLQRVMAAASYLAANTKFSLTDIAFNCGFASSAHFSRLFKSIYGINPSSYKKRLNGGSTVYKGMVYPEITKGELGVVPSHLMDKIENISFIQYNVF